MQWEVDPVAGLDQSPAIGLADGPWRNRFLRRDKRGCDQSEVGALMGRGGGAARRRGSHEPQPLNESLAVIAARIGAANVERFDEVCAQWPSIVGVLWAEHSRPVSISHGTLRISVTEPALAEQFRWARRDLIGAVNGILGENLVTELHTAFD